MRIKLFAILGLLDHKDEKVSKEYWSCPPHFFKNIMESIAFEPIPGRGAGRPYIETGDITYRVLFMPGRNIKPNCRFPKKIPLDYSLPGEGIVLSHLIL